MQTICSSPEAGHLIVQSEALKRALQLAEQVARHSASVLIHGETGTGKEMMARTIHDCSPRSHGPWVDVNCAALPEHLVESELFGYEKGAFSGADVQKPGLFELAAKGTLFLDEIGDLSLNVQVKLLRVLDGVPYYRLGGSRKIHPDVRVVAATNQDLEELVRTGRFRRDLFHRIAQFRIEVPPLRERAEDILGIAEDTLRQMQPAANFTADALDALCSYPWPGNVRELKNAVFNAALRAKNPKQQITVTDLQLPGAPLPVDSERPSRHRLHHVEREMILQALERTGGHQNQAAISLGISRRTLVRKLRLYRESGEIPAGPRPPIQKLNDRSWRADVNTPVRMKQGHHEFMAQLVNISLGGAAVAADRPLEFGARVSIYFAIPRTENTAELHGTVVWSDPAGVFGIRFTSLSVDTSNRLQDWLRREMESEQRKPNG
jgi:transcriptional regulator with PAS, ATPase and Fis domain